MGGSHSKRDALCNNDLRTVEQDEETKQCFGCLVPFRGSTVSAAPSRCSSHHGFGSRDSSAASLFDDRFGTPLPDTPQQVRRIRDRAMDNYYTDANEEKKLNLENYNQSSTYGGLEKEVTGMFSQEQQQPSNGGQGGGGRLKNGRMKHSPAEIYDGPVGRACVFVLTRSGLVFSVMTILACFIWASTLQPPGRRVEALRKVRAPRDPWRRLHLHLPPLPGASHQNLPRLQGHRQAGDRPQVPEHVGPVLHRDPNPPFSPTPPHHPAV